MRIPVGWLREYVPIDVPIEQVAQRLVISTCEVDAIETVGVADVDGNLGLFRVGRVLEAAKHPNADRLQLCQVDVGKGDARQIVCGAWNWPGDCRRGTPPGAVLPRPTSERRKACGELSDLGSLAEDESASARTTRIMVPQTASSPGRRWPTSADRRSAGARATTDRTCLRSGMARGGGASRRRVRALAGRGGSARTTGRWTSRSRTEACPRYVGRLFRDASIARAAVAQGAPAGRGDAADLQRRRRDQLRHARLGNPLHVRHAKSWRAEGRPPRASGEQLRTLTARRELDLRPDDRRRQRSVLAGSWAARKRDLATTREILSRRQFRPVHDLPQLGESDCAPKARTAGRKASTQPEQAARLATQLIVELTGARWWTRRRQRGPAGTAGHHFPPRAHRCGRRGQTPVEEQHAICGGSVSASTTAEFRCRRAEPDAARDRCRREVTRFRLDVSRLAFPCGRRYLAVCQAQRVRRLERSWALARLEAYTCFKWWVAAPGAVPLEPLSSEQAVLRTSLADGLLRPARRNVDAKWRLHSSSSRTSTCPRASSCPRNPACRRDRRGRLPAREGTVEGQK